MKTQIIYLLLLASVFFCCSEDSDDPNVAKKLEKIDLSESEVQVNAQVQDFSFDFFQEFSKERKDQTNYIVSPLGVSYVMGMALNGASGETYAQIQNTLGFSGYSNQSINQYMQTMRVALSDIDNTTTFINTNSLWLGHGLNFLSEFKKVNQTYYNAVLKDNQPFNSSTADEINAWCEEQTKGVISKFVEPDEISGLKALLLNTLYFKGKWKYPFEISNTKDKLFTLGDNNLTKVPMMCKKVKLQCVSNEEVTLVSLPYGNGAFAMQVFMPTDKEIGINDFLAGLSVEKWNQWIQESQLYSVDLSLPRFRVDFEDKKLKEVLEELGIKSAFTSNADFSKMSDASLFLSWLKQRSIIEVDEVGTVVASVTGSGLSYNSEGYADTLQVTFDRPFAFIILETTTGTVLFAGKVGNPVLKN